jgi:hypothetical protein
VKKNEVVAGKKLTRLSFEIFKIGHQEWSSADTIVNKRSKNCSVHFNYFL